MCANMVHWCTHTCMPAYIKSFMEYMHTYNHAFIIHKLAHKYFLNYVILHLSLILENTSDLNTMLWSLVRLNSGRILGLDNSSQVNL